MEEPSGAAKSSIIITKRYLDKLSYEVLGAAIEVHKDVGPGLLEGVYHECLKRELSLRNVRFLTELTVPVNFKGVSITTDLRCDLLIEDVLVVEIKAMTAFAPIHQAQLLTYMKLPMPPKACCSISTVSTFSGTGRKHS